MSDETKLGTTIPGWTCGNCGTDCPDRWFACVGCGESKPSPSPEPESSEYGKLWSAMRTLLLDAQQPTAIADGVAYLDSVAHVAVEKARSMLTPSAYDDGKRDGRREAYSTVIRRAERDDWNDEERRWLEQQRDACGPAKAERPSEFSSVVFDDPLCPGASKSVDIDKLADVLEDAFFVGRFDESERDNSADWRRAAICAAEFFRAEQTDSSSEEIAQSLLRSQQRVANLVSDVTALRAENERMKGELSEMTVQASTAQQELAATRHERDDLRAKLAEAEQREDELQEHRGQLNRFVEAEFGRFGEGWPEDAAIRIFREQKAEIARLTRELEGARGSQVRETVRLGRVEPAPQSAPVPAAKTVMTRLERFLSNAGLVNFSSDWPSGILEAAALDQAVAVEAATKEMREQRDRLQSEVHRLAAKCDGLATERDVAKGRVAELEKKLGEFQEAAGDAQGIDEENHHLKMRLAEAVRERDSESVRADANATAMFKAEAERDANAKAAVELEAVVDEFPTISRLMGKPHEIVRRLVRDARSVASDLAELRELAGSVAIDVSPSAARFRQLLHLDQPPAQPTTSDDDGRVALGELVAVEPDDGAPWVLATVESFNTDGNHLYFHARAGEGKGPLLGPYFCDRINRNWRRAKTTETKGRTP